MFRTTRSTLSAALLVAALTACGGQAAVPTDDASTPQPVSPSPSPEVDVAAAFSDAIQSPSFSVEADITGSIEAGNGVGSITGNLTSGGGASHLLIEVALNGQPTQVTEKILIGAKSYTREGELWFESPEGGASDDSFAAALGDLDSLTDAGIVERSDKEVHRLIPSEPLSIGAAALGFTDPTVSDFEGGAEYFATDDGTPAGLVIMATWRQDVNGQSMPAEMTLDYAFTSVDEPVEITAPDDLWVKFTSDAFGYQMAYPSTWEPQHIPASDGLAAADIFIAPVGLGDVPTELDIFHYPDLEAGIIANGWFLDSAAVIEESWGAALESSDAIDVNGLRAQLFSLHGVQDDGYEAYFQEAAVFAGTAAWDLDWYSAPGTEEEDRDLFLTMISTFRQTP